ncbi:MAG: hypothetical protein ACRDRO_15235 [Pseudonocardiaceae bacterium]
MPAEQVSIVGQDLHSETHVYGFVTTGDVAKTGAKSGAWVGGLFGVLTGAALLFVPGVGLLVVLGPLAAGALTAAEGAAAGGGLGAVLGHFIAKKHVPKYSRHLQEGNYLVLRHQPQAFDAQKLQAGHHCCRGRTLRGPDHHPRSRRSDRCDAAWGGNTP